ncbi:cysteine-tryptophan domain-containing zinc finger protein 7-like [Actinidia eriantha]|uniref:cysteine-tryptophan domain-containing zinc finger protein 7-like n=1 Tax=Actinidia eriantha TaxID=165200 RepID=UPI00258FD6E0|nr:cysteine-tryptophan domain-containing zinc finger protein 7-like [Actinidia eriantha]
MISLGSRDARKGIGLGLGFGSGSEMEETDLEEGETFSYQNDDYSTIDPDVALSYIDEKLQDVLGHFQKDFEGGVSAENLGAKFGGYGSFLPTCQRSPVLSHPRTPHKVQNSNRPRSPNKLHPEGGSHNSKGPSSAFLLVKHGQASATTSLPLPRASVNDSAKGDVAVSFSPCAEETTSGCEHGEIYSHPSDQKTLKVRIKVGSDNLSTRKNADIYSGLGLDLSSASSLDDIHADSEGFSREHQDELDESPTNILQIMTSFPVPGDLLLSPLPDDLYYLTEREKHQIESKPRCLQKGGQESSNRSDSAWRNDKVLGGKRPKIFEKNSYSDELKNLNDKDTQNGIDFLLKKETDIETLDCEELVASALKLPLLSNSYSKEVDSGKGNARVVDNFWVASKVKEESFSEILKQEAVEAVSTQEIGSVEKRNGKAASVRTVWEDKKVNSNGDILVYPKKESNVKVEKADVSAKVHTNVPKVSKAQNADPIDPLEEKASKKATSHAEDDMLLASGKEHSSSGEKKKSKGSQSYSAQVAEVPKDNSRMNSSSVPQNRKSTHANYYPSKSEMEDSKLQKDNGKARNNRYRNFFGDIELEQEDNDVDSEEMMLIGRPKHFEAVEKCTFASNGTSKEMLNGKKMDKPAALETYSRSAINAAPCAGNGSIADAAPGTLGPLVKEYWVCCDKCQKWRLLPIGTNPDSLPEKWLCSMLNWLPGMNRCSVSEEETTKALIAIYQVPVSENQNNQHGHPSGALPGLSLADASHFGQNRQNLGFRAVPSGGKKNGTKDVSAAFSQVGPAQLPNSVKKNPQAAVKSRSLNSANQSPPANVIEPIHLSTSSVLEKHQHKPKEKNKSLEQHSDGGETKSSKIKSKRNNDQDCFRISKKVKIDGMHGTGEDWIPDHDGLVGKGGPSSSSGLPVKASEKYQHKYNDHSSKDTSTKVPRRNPKDEVQVTADDGCLHLEKLDDKNVVRKRKMNESQDAPVYTAFLRNGHHPRDRKDFLEQTSEDIHRKEKKARVSKSEGKETSASKCSGGAAKRVSKTKDQQLGLDLGSSLSQQSLDGTDSLRRDLRSVRSSQAATSSSSKVSGSRKTKANMHEAKGSPVESVSSSPLRFSNPDKSTSTRRSLERKDIFGDAGTPRRCSDGEDDRGSNRSGTVRKDETFVNNRGSLESFVLDFQERGVGHLADSEANIQIEPSPEFTNCHFSNDGTESLGNDTQYPCKTHSSDQRRSEERENDKQYHAKVSHRKKSGKGTSSGSKDKDGSFTSQLNKGKIKISDSGNESIDRTPYEEKSRVEKIRDREKSVVNSDKVEKNFVGKKKSAGEVGNENSKRESQSKFEGISGLDVKLDAVSSQDQKQDIQLDRDERSSKRYLSEKTDRAEVSGKGKSHSLPPSGRGQNERVTHSPYLNSGSQKENGGNSLLIDASEGGDELKAPKQIYKSENQNGNQMIRSRHPTINGHRVRDTEAPSPVRRESSNQAMNAVKEAKDLKHLADRFKNSGSSAESTGLYFQAAVKFLHGASLLESSNGESAKQGEMIQSMQMYSSTAKLCEFCAHEYEKSKDMAAAALAYKCMEIAYMRVIYSSHTNTNRDQHELQRALQIVPPGESPSSSASDVDNLINPATLDKVPLAKRISSRQVAGNHVIVAKNRPSFVRLLNFAQDVNSAMEASRKSRTAFTAANLRKEEVQDREGITSVKTALDFNFQDVEGFLHLVRLAMEAIGR